MDVQFYVEGQPSFRGDDSWGEHIPQVGSEFCMPLTPDNKPVTTIMGTKYADLLVTKVVYRPWVSLNDGKSHYGFCDVDIYLKRKTEAKASNID